MHNQPCLVRPTLIDLNLDELHYYPLIISMIRCDGSCITIEDPFGRLCAPNRIEDMNLKSWNPSTCACDCDKLCETGEYMKNCECIKSLVDDLVVSCDETADTPETISINPSDGINYCLIAVVLLKIVCLLLLVVIVVKYSLKRELTISYLLSQYYNDLGSSEVMLVLGGQQKIFYQQQY